MQHSATDTLDSAGVTARRNTELVKIDAISQQQSDDSQALLKQGATVLDMIYDPLETRLLREAAQAGCAVISGFEMLLASAAAQFEVWTGAEAPVDAMRSSALLLAQTRST